MNPAIPPRIGSAPLPSNSAVGQRPPVLFGGSKLPGRSAAPPGGVPTPGVPGATLAVHQHHSVHHHSHHHHMHHLHHHHHHHHHPFARVPPPAAAEQNSFLSRVAEPTTPPAAAPSPAAPPVAAAAAAAPSVQTWEEYPKDLVYDIRVFKNLIQCKDFLPEEIKTFGLELWSLMADMTERPDHMMSRQGVFADTRAVVRHRIIQERKLHHEVRGILARVTPEKYDRLRQELLDLPIRQSDEADIKLVVETFFNKAIRPEDAPYAEYYVKLIAEMITHIGAREAAGAMIRREIVTQCQATFQNPDTLLTNPVQDEDLDPQEAEVKKKLAKDKLKANINLLGLLFLNGLVNEKVVTNVLFLLLYGPTEGSRSRRSRHVPADYEVEMFVELLIKTGKNITEQTKRFLDQFLSTMNELKKEHPSMRIRFMLMDAVETITNDFEPKRKAAKVPMKLDQFDENENRLKTEQTRIIEHTISQRQGRGFATQQSPTAPTPSKAPPVTPQVQPPAAPVITAKNVADALESYQDKGVAEVVQVLMKIDKKSRIAFLAKWMKRPMTVIRMTEERQRIGEVLSQLVHDSSKVLTHDDVQEILMEHLREVVSEGVHLEQTKYFSNWAKMTSVQHGEDLISPSIHSHFLRMVVEDENATMADITRLISDVSKEAREIVSHHDSKDHQRFRLLPALLLHHPAPERACEPDFDPDEEILSEIDDVEVNFFYSLYNDETTVELLASIQKHPDRADIVFSCKIVCAIFCFVRFDVNHLCVQRQIKDIMKKLVSFTNQRQPIEVAWLGEVYRTWKELDSIPTEGFVHFVRWMLEQQVISAASLTAFKAFLDTTRDAALFNSLRAV